MIYTYIPVSLGVYDAIATHVVFFVTCLLHLNDNLNNLLYAVDFDWRFYECKF